MISSLYREQINGRAVVDFVSEDSSKRNPSYAAADVKALAIAEAEHSPAVAPTRENVRLRTYPLSRSVFIFFNRDSSGAIQPAIQEFLRFVLSQEGRRDIGNEGDLPLTASRIDQALRSLQ